MKNTDTRFAIVVSRFNEEITEGLLEGALSRFAELGIDQQQITVVKVPGAREIPLTAKLLACSKKYQAIICLGAVIRGDTDHYTYVCQQVSDGCLRVMLQFDIPVIFEVLMTENVEQALDRIGGKMGHKGVDAVDVAMEMVGICSLLSIN